MRTFYEEIKSDILNRLEEYEGTRADELHHNLYNVDYYIIGRYQAEQKLNESGVFNVIRKIQEYEEFNFGEVNTDLTEAEHVVNMLAYIVGEEILSKSKSFEKILPKK